MARLISGEIMTKKTKQMATAVHCVVKRGRSDCRPYDERKVYGSVYAACYIVTRTHRKCERIAEAVAKKITSHVKKKKTVTSSHIFRHVIRELKKHDKNAAFMYETHRDIA